MDYFGQFYLDSEKDIIITLYKEGKTLRYVLRTPHHTTGNLITNLAHLCHLPITYEKNGYKKVQSYFSCTQTDDGFHFRGNHHQQARAFPFGTFEE